MSTDQRPLDSLSRALGSTVLVKLKDGKTLRGRLASYDTHVNLVLEETEEIQGDKVSKKYGVTIIRGDNVVFVSPAR
ncbi:hypothetical protein AKJ45_01040 [candidate division MSBL1 archaeon SCGC-AAA261F19]|uniref:Putative snRNP Sm-like protein n=2 Tax=candidate division MSBL1 TaxID=215777 RepID=A0A133VB03_9EURY|nr:hypothetical protein AKJ43_01230 [candidate division MSBL1 archaeon SCGC-AAA261D19]KXB03622.1 hypothetical protein AKJ45_01040 [candidate division MSBL1 archaeon SCGC-AAA261F19]